MAGAGFVSTVGKCCAENVPRLSWGNFTNALTIRIGWESLAFEPQTQSGWPAMSGGGVPLGNDDCFCFVRLSQHCTFGVPTITTVCTPSLGCLGGRCPLARMSLDKVCSISRGVFLGAVSPHAVTHLFLEASAHLNSRGDRRHFGASFCFSTFHTRTRPPTTVRQHH